MLTARAGGQLRQLNKDDIAAIRGLLATMMQNAVLAHRTREHELIKILDSGRLKPQVELKSVKHPDRSPDLERSVWSINDPAERQLPIYGYAATIDDVRGIAEDYYSRMSLRDAYGPARLVYRPDLRRRSTFTVGDSKWPLEQHAVVPGKLDDPNELAWCPLSDLDRDDLDHCSYAEIVEIQTLGGVYVEGIELVIFDAQPQQQTISRLNGHRVCWRVADWPNPPSPPAAGRRD